MSGSKIQLVSIGFEDLYLTVDPQITFFKMVYKRYTNFSIETIKQKIDLTESSQKKYMVDIYLSWRMFFLLSSP